MIRVLLASALFLLAAEGFAQPEDKTEPPYKRFPTLPPFRLMLTDSSSLFTKEDVAKKKAVMLMLFSPDCDHCQHKTEEIIQNIRAFDKVQIVMATFMPFDKMLDFYKRYDLGRFDNIVVGKEVNYLLPSFFGIHNLPFLAFYNKKKELISVFEGAMPLDKMLAEIRK